MIVFFAGLHVNALKRVIDTLGPQPHAGVLLSFFGDAERLGDAEYARAHGWKTFLDSGAFSAMRRKIPVKLADYSAFLAAHGSLFDKRANLDVIGDAGESAKNFERLRKYGVMPVFHVGSPEKHLDAILADDPAFGLGLGGMVGVKRTALLRWQAKTWTRIEKAAPRKVHGFGVTGTRTLAAFPWDSCDSTTPTLVGNRNLIPRMSKRGTPGFMNPAGFKALPLAQQIHVSRSFRGAHPGVMFETDAHRSQLLAETIRMILAFVERVEEHRERRTA